jgi:hypothetical protein
LENHEKRCSAGLIASTGQFSLDEEVFYVRHTKEQEEARVRQQQAKKKDIYDMLKEKVQVIKDKNLPLEKWTVAELNTVLQWYKNPSDTAMPKKKAENSQILPDLQLRRHTRARTTTAAPSPIYTSSNKLFQ